MFDAAFERCEEIWSSSTGRWYRRGWFGAQLRAVDVATYPEALNWLRHVDGVSDEDREWLIERSFRQLVME